MPVGQLPEPVYAILAFTVSFMTARQIEKRLIRQIAKMTDPDELNKLTWHEHCTDAVRLALAENPHTSAHTLEAIFDATESQVVRLAVLRHQNDQPPIYLDPRLMSDNSTREHDPRRRRARS